MHISTRHIPVLLASLVFASFATAETPTLAKPTARIQRSIDESESVTLDGNVHPLAKTSPSTAADDATPMEHMILYLKGDATQEAQLAQLVAQQKDPKSPLFGQFLTPQAFASQFGVAQADVEKVAGWLQGHGFTVEETPGNRAVVFTGTASQVAEAFKTEIRHYTVGGKTQYANATDPQIPAALAGVVGGVVKLHNFPHNPNISKFASVTPTELSNPQFTSGSNHYLSPADYATIYDINPLYSANINGSGQTIAVIARSNIAVSDVASFRSSFGLAANNPQIVIANTDPGVVQGDNLETTLDTEWSGAIAPKATIKVIVAASTNTADGIDLSALYAVNNNVAPIISLSYGSCEADMGSSELAFYNSLWQQAAAQGISVMVAAGDSGAAGCYSGSSTSASSKGINGLCSSPYSTCVGGSEFVEGSNPGQYWLAGNNPTYGSATGYIPEEVWNESGSNGGSGLWAGGGGVSIAYTKPSWQVAPGVPADGHRDVPDVSLTASGHDGYLITLTGSLYSVGGTSAATPSFAGLMALVDQKTGARQGLANTILYPLAVSQSSGGAKVFHDITTGNNSVPGLTGFSATTGYDMATGLGSVDANLLVNNWASSSTPTLAVTAASTTLSLVAGKTVSTTITTTASASLKSAVTLTITGLPAGVTAAFSSTTIASPGSGSATLTLTAASTAKVGSYSLTITATGGGKTATATVSTSVVTPTFTLAVGSTSVTANTGATVQASISATAQNGFSSALALSVSGLPTGVMAAFSPASISPTASGTGTSTLTLTIAKTAKAGSYPLTVTATGGGLTQTAALTLVATVPASCTLAANPTSVKLTAGQGTTVAVTCGSLQGTFAAPLAFSVTGAPSGLTVQSSSASVTAGTSATLSLSSALTLATGNYNLSLTASSGAFTQTLAIPLAVTAASTFRLTSAQSSLSVTAGSTGQVSVTNTHYGTFNSAVALSATGLPTGVTASFSKSTLAAPGDGTVTVTFTASSSAAAGTYNVSLTGTGGSQTETAPVTLTIVVPQNFAFSVSATTLTLQEGGAANPLTISTGNFTGGFNSTITITFSGVPSGVTFAVKGSTTGNNMVNTTLNWTATGSAPVGTYPVTVNASGAGITHSATVQMTVTEAATQTH